MESMVCLDPICYRFCFSCVTTSLHEPFIKAVFQELVTDLKPVLLPFLTDGFPKPCEWSEGEQGYFKTVKWMPTAQNGADATEDVLDFLLEKLQEETFHGFQLSCTPENDLKRYAQKRTAYTRDYLKLHSLLDMCRSSQSLLPAYRQRIQDLLDCPNDTLADLVVPLRHLRNTGPFEVSLFAIPCEKTKYHKTRCIIQENGEEAPADHYLHQINLVIPRFLLGGQENFVYQSSWMQAMKSLGEHDVLDFGSIGMDAPPSLYDYHGCTCYDDQTIFRQDRRYFAQYIPGYSWCTLLNSRQLALLNHPNETPSSMRLTRLSNGNTLLLMSDDMQRVTHEEAQSVRTLLKPFLPPLPLRFSTDAIPPSFRLGFSLDEIEYIGNDLYCLQVL